MAGVDHYELNGYIDQSFKTLGGAAHFLADESPDFGIQMDLHRFDGISPPESLDLLPAGVNGSIVLALGTDSLVLVGFDTLALAPEDEMRVFLFDGSTATDLGSLGVSQSTANGAMFAWDHYLLSVQDRASGAGREPYVYDLNAWGGGTLFDINPGPNGSSIGGHGFHPFDGRLYFSGFEGGPTEARLISTDGASFRVEPEPAYSVQDLKVFAGKLVINGWGNPGSAGRELWALTSSESTAQLVADINPDAGTPGGSGPELDRAAAANGQLFFEAIALGGSGSPATYGLFSYDGVTVTQVDAQAGRFYLPIGGIGGSMLAAVYEAGTGYEPYIWDGITFSPLPELLPGPASGIPAGAGDERFRAVVAGGYMLFIGDSPDTGWEIFGFDGMSVARVADVVPGPGPSSALSLTALGTGNVAFWDHGPLVPSIGHLRFPPAAITAPASATEGEAFDAGATVRDPDWDLLSLAWSVSTTGGVNCVIADPGAVSTTVTCEDETTATLGLTAHDGNAVISADPVAVTLLNAAPAVTSASLSQTLVQPGQTVTATVGLSDPGITDVITCEFRWGDPVSVTEVVLAASSTCSSTQALAAGAYPVSVTVSDEDGGSVVQNVGTLAVINKVLQASGTGTVNSPLGAAIGYSGRAGIGDYAMNKVRFDGTVVSGSVIFKLTDRGAVLVNFKSTSLSSFTADQGTGFISIRGIGTYNKAPGYTMIVHAVDAAYTASTTDVDTFRIRILNPSGDRAYDNGYLTGDNQPVRPGSTVILTIT